jgi:hypothetical protein
MTEKIEKEAEQLYTEGKKRLSALACNMQLIIPKAHVAQLFLGAGLAVLLSLGTDITRRWLETALVALDDDPERLH